MSDKALITRRGGASAGLLETNEIETLNFKVEHRLADAVLVRAESRKLPQLEARGYRVKLLRDTNLLRIGSYAIDIESEPPKVPANLEVPAREAATWPHHLVQLAGPPVPEWIREIEDRGVRVLDPAPPYGLFVAGRPKEVEALKSLPFVAWTGPFKPAYRIAPNLKDLHGRIRFVNVTVYPPEALPDVIRVVERAGGRLEKEWGPEATRGQQYRAAIVEIDAARVAEIAAYPAVRWMEFQSPTLTADDERSCQIAAENIDAAAPPNTAPLVGYQTALTTAGLSGAGVTVGICDSGACTNDNATMHPDLAGRMTFFDDLTGGVTPTDVDGHGSHVTGIAVGNAASGEIDPQGYLLGQGIAPAASFGVLNPVDTAGGPGTDPVADFTTRMVNHHADVMNNSWKQSGPGGSGYTVNAGLVDQLVRDPNPGTAAPEHLVLVFSAGNAGPGVSTITPPKEAKNPIVVGNSLNYRPGEGAGDDIRGISQTSSRGPALDGRILPTVVAPGTDIVSLRSRADADPITPGVQRPRAAYTDTGGAVHNDYTRMSGTSMSSPHVTGMCALLIEWWRNRTGGRTPSPAILKALLINGAVDLAGGPNGNGGLLAHIPNNDQGWGRVSLDNIIFQPPHSDRGPKIFSDQRHAFTAAGQEHEIRVSPVDVARPLRITLVWTDSPAAGGADPALVNDLDLEVTEVATGHVFKGNVFSNGFSVTGGAFDDRNNIECVYLEHPAGAYEVRVVASTIGANARPPFDAATPWQDFALVIDNAEIAAASPVSVVPILDRSGSMVASGYVDITKLSSRQFVDLMSVDDHLGVVSFSTTAGVEYPAGPGPVLQTITGQPIRDAAKTCIDAVAFGGTTFMGGGIQAARDLLLPATDSRAMVLLSDGYDNRGYVPGNPSALDVVATLPAALPIYTCAMGPASDQSLLEQIATLTGGRYYYMPTIDDLFEIYNYIRGQITGDAIVANESATASSSSVGAFIDSTEEATFTVAWANQNLHYTPSKLEKATDIAIRLRDPYGRLLPAADSMLRWLAGSGYAVFKLRDPAPGQWKIEVSTVGATHVRYTAGAFVKSKLRLDVKIAPRSPVAGIPWQVIAKVADGDRLARDTRLSAVVHAPVMGIPTILSKHKADLAGTRPVASVDGDKLPADIAKTLALRKKLIAEQKPDIFGHTAKALALTAATVGRLTRPEFRDVTNGYVLDGGGTLRPSSLSGVFAGRFEPTGEVGSYNVVATASGVSPSSRQRFVRKQLATVLVRPRP